MSKPLRFIHLLSVIINWTGIVIVVATVSSMFLALFINVVLRYAFGEGIAWAYEIHNILFPWLVAGGAVMAAVKGSNIAVTALVDILPASIRRTVAVAVHAFVAVLCIGVVYTAGPIIRAAQYSHLAETGISQMYGYWSLLYAFSAISLVAFLYMLRLLMGEGAGQSDPANANFS
jgi:TRAP-type C4-dicarboxylate transport system permease small subunit